ncbi:MULTISPECIES: phage holin family protein [Citrobacter]|uniref:phage holin family protein n=1 Tax=Citrobacter TaxID=544 RepID=UPI00214D8746|nr:MULTISPECIES: phage holin family protein [Citrobacter]MDM3217636.1 phage holin family protein [Citrobacter sp. Cf084]MEC5590875.1 phage holin family protein [Citrobacter freundii]
MIWHAVILDANAFVCLGIVIRLMFFSKAGKTHRPGYAWMAYLLILAADTRRWFHRIPYSSRSLHPR